jgi:hypothetical protein
MFKVFLTILVFLVLIEIDAVKARVDALNKCAPQVEGNK